MMEKENYAVAEPFYVEFEVKLDYMRNSSKGNTGRIKGTGERRMKENIKNQTT